MSGTFYLFAAGGLLGLVAFALHVVMIVHGFKVAAKWGLVNLLVPLGSLVFAFAVSDRRKLAVVFAAAILGAAGLVGLAAYRTAETAIDAAKTTADGLAEFEQQTDELSNIENLELDL